MYTILKSYPVLHIFNKWFRGTFQSWTRYRRRPFFASNSHNFKIRMNEIRGRTFTAGVIALLCDWGCEFPRISIISWTCHVLTKNGWRRRRYRVLRWKVPTSKCVKQDGCSVAILSIPTQVIYENVERCLLVTCYLFAFKHLWQPPFQDPNPWPSH